ncbi:PAS domain-containing sensor histidine kinase [Paramagnetospirillum marisnigri]|uniref:histidine kinase n=1 Tax=Paramagnetospirillum marisnigri TaxID=1285242 RepID=A0A178MIS5_9PROT|nr:ATP-binding protein [Paramagnetospirillum marisnigri]OAN48067.1 PAS domain-containing sensor histidine kinase [Paramagnetospirillum marisnigri]
MQPPKSRQATLSPFGAWTLCLIFLLLLGALTAVQLRAGYDRAIAVAAANLADTARVTEEQVQGSLRVVRLMLKAFAEAPQGDKAAFREFMAQRLKALPETRQALIVDEDGRIVVSTYPQVEGLQVAERPYFVGARSLPPGRDLHVTKPLPIGKDGALITIASMPLHDSRGRFQGALVVSLELSYFQTLLRSVHSGEDGAGALLVTPEGDIIGRDPAPEHYVGKNISKGGAFALHREAGSPSSIHTHLTVTDGKMKLSAVRTLADPSLPPLVVIVGRPLDGVLAPWRAEALIQSLVVATLALAVIGLTALALRRLRALREGEQRYRGLIETQSDLVVRIAPDHRFTFVNDAFARAFGHGANEVIGQPWQDYVHEADIATTAQAIAQTMVGPAYRAKVESRMNMPGTIRWVSWEGCAIHGMDGRIFEVQAVGRDITDWVEFRETQRRLVRDLDASNRELEQFAYVASHDLQTPLRNIVSYAQLLERRYKNRLDQDADDFIGFIVDNSKRMTCLIGDLLEYSRVSNQSAPWQPCSAAEAMALAIDNLTAEIKDSGAEISVGQLPVVMGEPTHLVSLFQNLVGNALKYRDPSRKPMISVTAEPDQDGMWRFAVKDNGIGIAAEYHDKIFEIFQRLDPSSHPDGTGIGLTLCRRIVHRFGGGIWLDSAPGLGTTFTFTLHAAPN